MKNTIHQDDCLEIMKSIPDKSIDCIITDPPYTFTKGSNGGGGMCDTRKSHKEIHSNLGSEHTLDVGIDNNFFGECMRVLKIFNLITFCNSSQLPQILSFAEKSNLQWNLIIWHKTNPIPLCRNKYLDDIEYIVQIKDKGIKIGGSYHSKSKVYTSVTNKKDKKIYNHPTIKPVELIEKFIINHTNEGEIILDPFAGSGTTGVACKNLNRNYILIEQEPEYIEIIKNRLAI